MTFDNLDDYQADQRDNERRDEPSAEYQRGYNERKSGEHINGFNETSWFDPPIGTQQRRQYRAGWAAADAECRAAQQENTRVRKGMSDSCVLTEGY